LQYEREIRKEEINRITVKKEKDEVEE